jgi:hypothetical protein
MLAESNASPGAGAQAPLVEPVGGLRVSVFVQERIDLLAYLLVGNAQLLSRQGARQRQRRGGATAKAHRGADLALLDERDILDE